MSLQIIVWGADWHFGLVQKEKEGTTLQQHVADDDQFLEWARWNCSIPCDHYSWIQVLYEVILQ